VSLLSESELQMRCRLVDVGEHYAALDATLREILTPAQVERVNMQVLSMRKLLFGSLAAPKQRPLTGAAARATLHPALRVVKP